MALGFITTDTMDTRRNGPRTTRKNFLPRFYKQGGQAIDIFRLCKNTVDDWPRAGWYSGIVLVGSYKKYFIYLTAQLVHACISWCVPETQKKKKATSSHKIPCSLDCATRFLHASTIPGTLSSQNIPSTPIHAKFSSTNVFCIKALIASVPVSVPFSSGNAYTLPVISSYNIK